MKVGKIAMALGHVDEELLLEASAPPKKRPQVRGLVLAAACIALVVLGALGVRYGWSAWRYNGGEVFADSRKPGGWLLGAAAPELPPVPWEDSLYLTAEILRRSLKPGEPVELLLETGLNDNCLGPGCLELQVTGADFTVAFDGVNAPDGRLILETPEAGKSTALVLTPAFAQDWANGDLELTVRYVFADADAFYRRIGQIDGYENWQELFIQDGALTLARLQLGYAFDGRELRVIPNRGGMALWYQLLGDHYVTWRISGREFARLYFACELDDRISAMVNSRNPQTGQLRYEYFSKNIRYQSPYVESSELWQLQEAADAAFENQTHINDPEADVAYRALARGILAHMLETGVITQEEYARELSWMDSVSNVNIYGVGYPGKIAKYDVVRKYTYTHEA